MRELLDYFSKGSMSSVSNWKIDVNGLNKSGMKIFRSKIIDQIQKYEDITIIGFGINDGIKSSVFFQQRGDILRILTTEIQIIVTEMGLRSKNTAEISALVTNEILSEISVDNKVNTGSIHLNKGIIFAGCFVINEQIKHQMIPIKIPVAMSNPFSLRILENRCSFCFVRNFSFPIFFS